MSTPPTASRLRLMSDLKAIQSAPPEGCSASPLDDSNLYVWCASLVGASESPWYVVYFVCVSWSGVSIFYYHVFI